MYKTKVIASFKREIKFRAWDDLNKKMHFWTLNDLLLRWGEPEYQFTENKPSPFFKWMQFSGLKDIEGKEIYEDDIVQNDKITGNIWENPELIKL